MQFISLKRYALLFLGQAFEQLLFQFFPSLISRFPLIRKINTVILATSCHRHLLSIFPYNLPSISFFLNLTLLGAAITRHVSLIANFRIAWRALQQKSPAFNMVTAVVSGSIPSIKHPSGILEFFRKI